MTATTRFIGRLVHALGALGSARRALVASVILVGIATSTTSAAQTAGDDPVPRVVERDGVYQVAATLVVPHAAGIVTAVLTDYEHIPEFLSDVRISRVLEHGAGRTVVRQEAVARFLLFSRRIHLELEIVETPGRIQFRDIGGKSFLRYEGEWRISEDGPRTRITYELTAQPAAAVSGALVRRLFARDLHETIAQLKREIARRAATPFAIVNGSPRTTMPTTNAPTSVQRSPR